ncbi:MAG: hypothetical protein MHPSP_000415 [Paramarteilia canceri]
MPDAKRQDQNSLDTFLTDIKNSIKYLSPADNEDFKHFLAARQQIDLVNLKKSAQNAVNFITKTELQLYSMNPDLEIQAKNTELRLMINSKDEAIKSAEESFNEIAKYIENNIQ